MTTQDQILTYFEKFVEPGQPVSRNTLKMLTGQTDRKNRDAIAELQARGYPIISIERGYVWGNASQVSTYIRREMTRAKTIFKKLRGLNQKAQDLFEQLDLEF